ncbi:hypothetical protein G6F42_019705 [Rhizopus arrhizus]|nr:hypothetical protein G6F42_019705 [Rhizopus arrhizus]
MPVYSTANLILNSGNEDQFVKVSNDLWKSLVPVNDTQEFITVSVSVPSLAASSPVSESAKTSLSSFIAHCKPTKQGEGKNVLYVSSQLIKAVYGQDALSRLDEEDDEEDDQNEDGRDEKDENSSTCLAEIKPVELIELDELIIGALNQHSYEFAQKDQEALIQLFVKQPKSIIRSSGQYHFDNGLSYEVLMTNPVQQGYIFASDRTRVLTVDMSDSEHAASFEAPSSITPVSSVFHMHNSSIVPSIAEPKEFSVKILQKKWPESRLYPSPSNTNDDESRVYVDVRDLAQCGVFSGEWMLVSGNNPKKSRLCRVFGVDDVADTQNNIYLPPVLYFNLDLPLPPAPTDDIKVTITKVNSPPADGPPIAQAVSIARIASPASMDKALQSAFLESLKQWFEAKERIVCKGDIIAICLDEDSARLKPQDDDLNAQEMNTKPTTLAYFKVTRLDQADNTDSAGHPSYFGSCRRIVPSKTQMIQTGVEYSRVPIQITCIQSIARTGVLISSSTRP